MTKKLFVGNLPDGCTKEELEGLLKRFGTVVECDVILNKNFGFVHMNSETEAQEAVTQLDSSPFMGNIIKVQFSTTDVHKIPGVGSKGECFRCGSKGHLSRDCDQGGGNRSSRGRGGRGGRGGSRGRGGFGRDPYREDRGRPSYRGYGNGFTDDLYRDERPPMRRGLSRDFDFERRLLDDAYSRRMPLSMREYELLYRTRDRSPIRGYDRPLYSSRSDIYDRLYSSRSSGGFYDMPMRSRLPRYR